MNEIKNLTDPEKEAQSEGWWASVLAEDECSGLAAVRNEGRHKAEKNLRDDQSSEINWTYVQDLLDQEKIITGTVIDCNKGGLLICTDDFQGFVPVSHLDDVIALEDGSVRDERLQEYMNCRLRLKVIECDPQRGKNCAV